MGDEDGRKPKGRPKGTLTKDEVVGEALALIEEKGVEACSMRNVAARIGVTAMALYSYVPSRDALLNEACKGFLEGIELRTRSGEAWDDTLLRCMHTLRIACVRHPRLAELMGHPAVGSGLEPFMARLRSVFLAQGMPEDVAIQLTVAADAFFAGFMLRARQLVEREAQNVSGDPRGDVPVRSRAPIGGSGTPAEGFRPASRGVPGADAPSHPADASRRLSVTSRVPGMLTGHARDGEAPALNDRWRRTLSAGYSSQSFENGLVIIVEGVRACVSPDPCDWRTPA